MGTFFAKNGETNPIATESTMFVEEGVRRGAVLRVGGLRVGFMGTGYGDGGGLGKGCVAGGGGQAGKREALDSSLRSERHHPAPTPGCPPARARRRGWSRCPLTRSRCSASRGHYQLGAPLIDLFLDSLERHSVERESARSHSRVDSQNPGVWH